MSIPYDHSRFDGIGEIDHTIPSFPSTGSELTTAPKLIVCDATLTPVGSLDTYVSLSHTARFRSRHSWSIIVPRDTTLAAYLITGNILLYNDPDAGVLRPFLIRQIVVHGEDETIELSGTDYASALFEKRFVLAGTLPGTGEYSETGLADDVFRSLVSKNVTAATRELLRDSLIHLETQIEPVRGLSIIVPIKYDVSLLDAIESACLAGNIGWDAVVIEDETTTQGWSIELRCLTGRDLSETNTGGTA